MLLLLYQFEQGLTELDFGIINSLSKFKLEFKIENLSRIIDIIKGHNLDRELMKFVEIIEIKGSEYRQIRLNEFGRLYVSRECPLLLTETRLKSLQYLTIYTIAAIKYLTCNFHYHESMYEFSNISNLGIFEVKKIQTY